MTMRTVGVSGIAMLVLTACSTAPPASIYEKAGVSAEQVARDRTECAAAAAASDSRGALHAPEREGVESCMRARGYTVRSAPGADDRGSPAGAVRGGGY
jgi:hypothetical protein